MKHAKQRFERLPNDAPEETRLRERWAHEEQLAKSYIDEMIGDIDLAAVLDSYRRAIKQEHPRLVNLKLLRRTDYTLPDAASRNRARRAIESGRSVTRLGREGLLGTFDPYQSEEWGPVIRPGYLHPDQVAELEAGDVVYPDRWNTTIVYIHATKILSRVRPYQPIQGDNWFARRVARHLVFEKRRLELESSLRKSVRVEEDAVVVETAQSYPECEETRPRY